MMIRMISIGEASSVWMKASTLSDMPEMLTNWLSTSAPKITLNTIAVVVAASTSNS